MKLLRVMISGIWIAAVEFVRNQILLLSLWERHYETLGLKFQTLPVNALFWVIWSFILAGFLYFIGKKYNLFQAIIISWVAAFPMMWITLYNLQVLPLKLLLTAVPFSLFEVAVAALIIGGKSINMK
ncbi:MAG: hypothetical protein H6681_03770 [Desulfobacteraceae bacterium]|nr:hypothetical protein [Desulfobacteraceae bacterium]